jgi:hypothetical protein
LVQLVPYLKNMDPKELTISRWSTTSLPANDKESSQDTCPFQPLKLKTIFGIKGFNSWSLQKLLKRLYHGSGQIKYGFHCTHLRMHRSNISCIYTYTLHNTKRETVNCGVTSRFSCIWNLVKLSTRNFHYLRPNPFWQIYSQLPGAGVAQSVQCLTTDWMTWRSGFDPWQRQRDFSSSLCPDQLWDRPNFLFSWYRGSFPWR